MKRFLLILFTIHAVFASLALLSLLGVFMYRHFGDIGVSFYVGEIFLVITAMTIHFAAPKI